MPFHNFNYGIVNSPLVHSVFTQNFSDQGASPIPPPGSFIMQMETGGEGIGTENDILIITE